jgi:sugar/nucleoside kinase (ribokinase family)
MEQVDYLVIGHVSQDITPDGKRLGGTVSYAGRTAQALGCRTAVLTSIAANLNLSAAFPGILTHNIPASETSTFTNRYTPQGRQQTLHSRAVQLTRTEVPTAWQRASIVHLAPIADEVDPEMVQSFSNSLIGLTPQGWLRRWTPDGRIYAQEWPQARDILPLAAAVILSEEDLLNPAMLANYRQWSRLLVLTQGRLGCTVYCGGESRQIAAPIMTEVEPTGAGDIFAAAFFIRLFQTDGNPWEAARFANEIAAQSVTQISLEDKIRQVNEYVELQSLSAAN